MRVIRECLDDVRPCMNEIAMHLLDHFGMIDHRFGHERTCLNVAAALELEQITFGADKRPLSESLDKIFARRPFGKQELLHARHTHGQWLLLAPNVLPAAKRE